MKHDNSFSYLEEETMTRLKKLAEEAVTFALCDFYTIYFPPV